VNGRHYAYANCSEEEYQIILARANRDGLTVSDYVRRCINGALLEEGDNVQLLEERGGSGRRRRYAAL